MKTMIAQVVLFGVAILLIKSSSAEYDVAKYCQLVQPGTKLPSLESCEIYYICLANGIAPKYNCPDDNVFDKDAQNCIPQSESNCYFGLSNPCQNKNNEFAYCSNGCNWYNYCINGEIVGNGTCVTGEIFYPPNGTCINGHCDDSDKYRPVDLCTIIPDGVYYGDFENCHAWHKCSAAHEEHGICENGQVYNTNTGQCLVNDGTMCYRTNNVVQSQASGPPQVPCNSPNQTVADTNVCSIYYTCQMNNQGPATTYEWVQQGCKNQYFDVISQECTDRTYARVHPSCDRCEFTATYAPTYWANAVDPNCQKYFTCINGKQQGSNLGYCEEGHYFDEGAQYCIEGEERLEQYKVYNGACQDYECYDTRECSLIQ